MSNALSRLNARISSSSSDLGCFYGVVDRIPPPVRGLVGFYPSGCGGVLGGGRADRSPGPRDWIVRKERVPTPAQNLHRRFARDPVSSDYRRYPFALLALPLKFRRAGSIIARVAGEKTVAHSVSYGSRVRTESFQAPERRKNPSLGRFCTAAYGRQPNKMLLRGCLWSDFLRPFRGCRCDGPFSHGLGSCEIIPGRAKAFHAKAQSRRGRKENKAVVLCESLRLGVFA